MSLIEEVISHLFVMNLKSIRKSKLKIKPLIVLHNFPFSLTAFNVNPNLVYNCLFLIINFNRLMTSITFMQI